MHRFLHQRMYIKELKEKYFLFCFQEEKEEEHIMKNREHLIDALVIRVMKANKQLRIKEIIENVFKLTTSFIPQPKLIKTRIESLIGREYLKRDEKDM